MNKKQKISIRFFDDREVRAVWDEQNAKWWFSVWIMTENKKVQSVTRVTQHIKKINN